MINIFNDFNKIDIYYVLNIIKTIDIIQINVNKIFLKL